MNRREIIKRLATVPILGTVMYGWYKKNQVEKITRGVGLSKVFLTSSNPIIEKNTTGDKIRLGIIGAGGRGRSLIRDAGFIEPSELEKWKIEGEEDPNHTRYKQYLEQENLNLELVAVCDVFDVHAEKAVKAGANIHRALPGGEMGKSPKRYRTYQELLADETIDAVIIATPDHWHGTITIAAAKAGKHVYCEKPMTWTVPETYEVVKAVKENNIVFQLGHQNRQTESYFKAKEAIQKGVIGKVNLIEVTTNRNSPGGAWVYDIHPDANEETIDWKQFIGPAPDHEFSLERFFRWRCWWDYSTGLSGDLFTHDYDAMNQILELGIPHSVVSSGGIYHFKDGRTVPDVLHAILEYPDKDLSLVYSASLASGKSRGRVIMAHDGYMEVGGTIQIFADEQSTKYKKQITEGTIDPNVPIYTYTPGKNQVDGLTSATDKYFASRGLVHSYHKGKRVSTTHLHVKEWIGAIRDGTPTSCNIDRGFEEAITAHMGMIAYRENRKVFWDAEKQLIV